MANLNVLTKGIPPISHEKQGHLGDLLQKSTIELEEILHRQEHIWETQQNLLKKLPDKGRKIENTIKRLKAVLAQKKSTDSMSSMFEQMSLKAETKSAQRTAKRSTHCNNSPEMQELLATIINDPERDKVVINKPMSGCVNPQGSDSYPADRASDRLLEAMTTNTLAESNVSDSTPDNEVAYTTHPACNNDPIVAKFVHIEEYGKKQREKRAPFNPHQSLKHTDAHDAASELLQGHVQTEDQNNETDKPDGQHSPQTMLSSPGRKTMQQQSLPTNTPTNKLKYRYDESLEKAFYGDSACQRKAQVIDIQSALVLEQEKKHRIQELQTQQAIDKLTQRFSVDSHSFDADSYRQLRARETEYADEEGENEADSEQETDYPE